MNLYVIESGIRRSVDDPETDIAQHTAKPKLQGVGLMARGNQSTGNQRKGKRSVGRQ